MNQAMNHMEEKVQLSPLERDGDKLLETINGGSMAAVLSGAEIMYIMKTGRGYECFIHPIGDEDGRHKTISADEPGRAIIKNLANLGDQLFKIEYKPNMHYMGVMVAAENGILAYLNMMHEMPGEDVDFMDWQGEGRESEGAGTESAD
jgi:hypothetical protein